MLHKHVHKDAVSVGSSRLLHCTILAAFQVILVKKAMIKTLGKNTLCVSVNLKLKENFLFFSLKGENY